MKTETKTDTTIDTTTDTTSEMNVTTTSIREGALR